LLDIYVNGCFRGLLIDYYCWYLSHKMALSSTAVVTDSKSHFDLSRKTLEKTKLIFFPRVMTHKLTFEFTIHVLGVCA